MKFLQLTDVEKGGETAFPQAGVRSQPKKGSAIFWYNMYSSGEEDVYTQHGSCPIIFGQKLGKNIRMKCVKHFGVFLTFQPYDLHSGDAVDPLRGPESFTMSE